MSKSDAIAGHQFLIWWDPSHNRVVQSLEGRERLLVGRSLDSDIVIAERTVSRRHALLSRAVDVWFIEDAGSRSGTFVRREGRGQPLVGRAALRDGDEIYIGLQCLTYGTALDWEQPATHEPAADGPPDFDLTAAQARVLLALCAPAFDGRAYASNVEIAQQLGCELTTLRSHLKELYREFQIPDDLGGYRRRAALVTRALISNVVTKQSVDAALDHHRHAPRDITQT
jgi:hypothetical protein